MPRRAVEPSKKSVSLQIASSVTVAWESVLWPWFENVSPGTWKSPLPSLVLVPTRAQANDLKRRLIGKHLSHLGLHFVTPAGLRILLGREDLSPAAEPEHLRLILAAAATDTRGSSPMIWHATGVTRASEAAAVGPLRGRLGSLTIYNGR